MATEKMAHYLTRAGIGVHVVTGRMAEEPVMEERDGIKIHRIEAPNGMFGPFRYYYSLQRVLKEIDPDIIHAQGLYLEAVMAVRCARKWKKKVVVSPRGSDILRASPAVKWIIGGLVLKHADLVLVQNEYMRKESEKLAGGLNTAVLPNGVDSIPPIMEKKGFILFVGRLHRVKGVDVLIEAMGKVVESEAVELRVVGTGDEEEKLKRMVADKEIEDRVSFLGKKTGMELQGLMGQAEILILPSRSEAFPMTIVESLAAGTPVIASNVGGIPEVIRNGKEGILVEPRDPDGLADAIIELMQNPGKRKKMAENARKRAENYLWENIVAGLVQYYEEMLSKM